MATRNTAKIVTAADVAWTTGDLFNGFLLLLIALPASRGSAYLKDSQRQRVPLDIKIPVLEGVVQDKVKIWQTTELEPPNMQYCALWYDDTLLQIAVGPSLFTVTTEEHTVTPPTLTSPTVAIACPTPGAPLTDSSVIGLTDRTIIIEQTTGTGASVTITQTPFQIQGIYFNGMLLKEGGGDDYTVSGLTISFISPLTVASDDVVMAVYSV